MRCGNEGLDVFCMCVPVSSCVRCVWSVFLCLCVRVHFFAIGLSCFFCYVSALLVMGCL